IERLLTAAPLVCAADEALMASVLVNVILNAIQAMPDGGRLTLTSELRPGSAVVQIADTGVGFPSEDLDRVFEPFHTTKSRGLGLGLPYARKVIEQHRGEIHISSKPGQGTRVIIRLPAED